MPTGEHPDVTSTLSDLERKLVDLERELNSVAGGTVAATASASSAPLPAPDDTRDPTLRVEDLRGEIAGLVRFRDQLESAARELVTEYDRLVARLRVSGSDEAPPAAGGPFAPAPESAAAAEPAPATALGPPAATHPLPPAVAAGLPGQAAAAAPAAGEHDELTFEGAVVIDAGPFTDITTLQSFEQSLTRVPGAADVYVRSFEGDRALVDVRLSNPVPLVHLLRNELPWSIIAREAGSGRLSIDVVAADHHGI
jgi:hypothetical protein